MKAFNVTNVSQVVAVGGNRSFIHILNNSIAVVYVGYDGDSAALTTANGMPIQPGALFTLNNDNSRNIYDQDINIIAVDAGPYEVRVQGA